MGVAELLQVLLPAALALVGLLAGRLVARREDRRIAAQEAELRDVLVFSTRYCPPGLQAQAGQVVSASVVMSADYFIALVSALRNLFGGRFVAYERMMQRGRRLALVRLKAEARARGASVVLGVRYECTGVAHTGTPAVEVLAYGTAMVGARQAAASPHA